MPQQFLGFDHADVRVRALAAVEAFYDAIMPRLGLTRKTFSRVDAAGDWHDATRDANYNVVEYFNEPPAGEVDWFIGFIEDAAMTPVSTRFAFRVRDRAALVEWEAVLRAQGARAIEFSEDMTAYPALFFEDPAGTKLELCARNPRRA